MDERLLGELTAYAYMVHRGKPASSMAVKSVCAKSAERFIKNNYGLDVYCEELTDGWVTFWIYKYPHILNIIKSLNRSPQSTFDHWVQGKLFGYEEAEIAKFLNLNPSEK